MTDHPRFHVAGNQPDDCYREYHGAVLVEWAFRVADWWLKHRDATNSIRLGHVQPVGEAAP